MTEITALIDSVVTKFKNDERTLDQVSLATKIQTTRVHRLRKGYPFKLTEWVAVAKEQGLTLDTVFHAILEKDLENEKTKELAIVKSMKLDTALKITAEHFNMTPELLVWKMHGAKNAHS